MPRALPFPLREQIVRRHHAGEPLTAIAADLDVKYRTVRAWWARFRLRGDAGLQTHYQNCGPKAPKTPADVPAAALAMKREHSTWGAGLIRLQLVKQFPDVPLPQVRAIQRWFRAAGLAPARVRRPRVSRKRGKAPHEVWEVDAKEQMRLGDGAGTSVLTVTDEASGAILGLVPFPPVLLDGGRGDHRARGDARVVCPVGPACPDPRR